MLQIKNAKFIKSIMDWTDGPTPPLPEIAFVGRSNVGKSSLINCLVNIRNFARVSKQPGKTRTINYFSIDENFYLVDLPGYGFAKISRAEKAHWQQAIEQYLLNRRSLKMLMVLIDGKVGPKDNDVQLVEWLNFHQIPYRIIATKIDRVSKNSRPKQRKLITELLGKESASRLLMCSAKDNTGKEDLLNLIESVLKQD